MTTNYLKVKTQPLMEETVTDNGDRFSHQHIRNDNQPHIRHTCLTPSHVVEDVLIKKNGRRINAEVHLASFWFGSNHAWCVTVVDLLGDVLCEGVRKVVSGLNKDDFNELVSNKLANEVIPHVDMLCSWSC